MIERESLFRSEVLPNHRNRYFSAPLLQRNDLSGVFVLISLLLVAATLLLLGFIRYRESETTRGVLEPVAGSHRVVAPTTAIVEQVLVKVGDTVAKGQVLAELERATFDSRGGNAIAKEIGQMQERYLLLQEQQALQSQQFQSASQQARQVLEDHSAALAIIDSEQDLLQQTLQLNESRFAAMQRLSAARAVTRAQLEQAQIEYLEVQLRLQGVLQRRQTHEQQMRVQESRLQNLDQEHAQIRLTAEQEAIRLKFAITEVEDQSKLAVVAAVAGVIGTVAIEPGQHVQALQPMFYVQTGPLALQANLYVSSRVLGKLYPGQEVLLSYDAFDMLHYGRYAATIQRIDRASLDPREHLLPVPGIQEPVFRITAALEQAWVEGDDVYRLQPGMLFSADIVLQEMSLLQFIFKPVLKLRARIA